MLYVDNTDNLHDEKSPINDMQIIQDIVKKSGMRAKIVAPPERRHHEKRYLYVVFFYLSQYRIIPKHPKYIKDYYFLNLTQNYFDLF